MNKKMYATLMIMVIIISGCSPASEYDSTRLFSQKELDNATVYSYDKICSMNEECTKNKDKIAENVESSNLLGIDYRHGVSLDDRNITIDHIAHANEEFILLYDITSTTSIPMIAFYEDGKLVGYYLSDSIDIGAIDAEKGSGYDLFIKKNNVASLQEFVDTNADLEKSITDASKMGIGSIIEISTILSTENKDFEFEEEIKDVKDMYQKAQDSYNYIKEYFTK